MSFHQKNQNRASINSDTNESNNNNINTNINSNSNSNSINSIQLRYFNANINNKRYSNSSNKNNMYLGREENEEIDKLNKIYEKKEKEYNNLLIQYREIVDCLNQKKEFLNENKSKYQSLRINNENMKAMLIKLMKIKSK